ncbi:MAG: topoisomerase DNA-binding C4 zinc finger domain-containing protein [Candidatus Parcubacteria bacterium]|nr:topoisomerase DNA-binding C4 zinc finger domain-containing protein [Candidatus Paceibacterota bacterium]
MPSPDLQKNKSNKTNISLGQKFNLGKLLITQKYTQAPYRFSAASLIKQLEELGIGRPSTYASTISTLQDRGYVEAGNTMKPTTLGTKVDKILVDNFRRVTDSQMTADMESSLDKISEGQSSYTDVLDAFWWDFKKDIESKSEGITGNRDMYRSTPTDLPCPTCNSQMELKIGRFGEYFQCLETREHQFAKNFREYNLMLAEAQVLYTNQLEGKICTECDKQMIIRVSKASLKPYIACSEYRVGNKHTITNIILPGQEGKETKPKGAGKFSRFTKKTGAKAGTKATSKTVRKAKTK